MTATDFARCVSCHVPTRRSFRGDASCKGCTRSRLSELWSDASLAGWKALGSGATAPLLHAENCATDALAFLDAGDRAKALELSELAAGSSVHFAGFARAVAAAVEPHPRGWFQTEG